MPEKNPAIKRFNLDDPAVFADFVKTGRVWQFPQYWQMAIDAINKGTINKAECQRIPAEAMGALD